MSAHFLASLPGKRGKHFRDQLKLEEQRREAELERKFKAFEAKCPPLPGPFTKEQLEENSKPDPSKRNRQIVLYGHYLNDLEAELVGGGDNNTASGSAAAAAQQPRPFQVLNVGGDNHASFVNAISAGMNKTAAGGVEAEATTATTVPSVAVVYGTTRTYPTDETYPVVAKHLRRYLQSGNKLLVTGGCWDLQILQSICKCASKDEGGELEGVVDKPKYTGAKYRHETDTGFGGGTTCSRGGSASLTEAGKAFFQDYEVPKTASFKGTWINSANLKEKLYADKKGRVPFTFHLTQWGSAVIHIIDHNAQIIDWIRPLCEIWQTFDPHAKKKKTTTTTAATKTSSTTASSSSTSSAAAGKRSASSAAAAAGRKKKPTILGSVIERWNERAALLRELNQQVAATHQAAASTTSTTTTTAGGTVAPITAGESSEGKTTRGKRGREDDQEEGTQQQQQVQGGTADQVLIIDEEEEYQ